MKSLLILLLVASSPIFADTPLGLDSIRLPDGYTFDHHNGTDSYVGTIQKPGGLTIHMDSGLGAVPLHRDKEKFAWYREIQIGGQPAELAMGGTPERRHLLLFYPSTWVLFSTEIHSEADIAEFIALLSTYVPSKK